LEYEHKRAVTGCRPRSPALRGQGHSRV